MKKMKTQHISAHKRDNANKATAKKYKEACKQESSKQEATPTCLLVFSFASGNSASFVVRVFVSRIHAFFLVSLHAFSLCFFFVLLLVCWSVCLCVFALACFVSCCCCSLGCVRLLFSFCLLLILCVFCLADRVFVGQHFYVHVFVCCVFCAFCSFFVCFLRVGDSHIRDQSTQSMHA